MTTIVVGNITKTFSEIAALSLLSNLCAFFYVPFLPRMEKILIVRGQSMLLSTI